MQCNNCNCCNNEEQYEEFVLHNEYPVEGFFKIGKEVFKVVKERQPDESCTSCDIEGRCYALCTKWDRKDHTEVYFILYDTIDDDEL